MTLEQAIDMCNDASQELDDCIAKRLQIAEWLSELLTLRKVCAEKGISLTEHADTEGDYLAKLIVLQQENKELRESLFDAVAVIQNVYDRWHNNRDVDVLMSEGDRIRQSYRAKLRDVDIGLCEHCIHADDDCGYGDHFRWVGADKADKLLNKKG